MGFDESLDRISVWIGPTGCDSAREVRTRTVAKIWGELTRAANLAQAHPMLGGAVDLFRESLSCYQNGAYMASTLMCRRTTEAAVYLAASRKPSPSPGKLEIDFQRIREKWGPIRDRAEKLRLITQSDLLIMNEIRDRGNYTAHYGQRYDQRTQSDIATTMRLGFWADKKQTEDTLQKTAIVLGHIIERFLAQGSPKLLVHHRGEEEPRDLACRFQPV